MEKLVIQNLGTSWLSISYHMRGRRHCEAALKTPTVMIAMNPGSEKVFPKIQSQIEDLLNTSPHPHITIRQTPSRGIDVQNYELSNASSIGAVNDKMEAGALGEFVLAKKAGGTIRKSILTCYSNIRSGEPHTLSRMT